jgi:hypothetical protein
MTPHLIPFADFERFALAGAATFTIVSHKTETRFTYRVQAPAFDLQGEPLDKGAARLRFVSVLTGPDSNYTYLGLIKLRPSGWTYEHGVKSRIRDDAPSARAFAWLWRAVASRAVPTVVDVYHEGKCGRCGRPLTVPSSIVSGFGPDCLGKVAA